LISPNLTPRYSTPLQYASDAYIYRTFNCFLSFLGLVELNKAFEWDSVVTATDLFGQLIDCPPYR
jgi:hypothetical protein